MSTTFDTQEHLAHPLHFPISIAPMMDHTDRHFRMLMRTMTSRALLYTEMISAKAILHGDTDRHLAFSEQEKPLILQVGGSDLRELAECTKIACDYGYDEVNLNTGCPSERVHSGSFGAALMACPEKVGEIVHAMRNTNTIPVSVKCRVGIDGSRVGLPVLTEYEHLVRFAKTVLEAGASRLVVHARIAILGGLSPKENRTIPPLNYNCVYSLVKEFPHHRIEINGGIRSQEAVHAHLQKTSGVMLGRVVLDNPMCASDIDTLLSAPHKKSTCNKIEIARRYARYLHSMQHKSYTHHALRHLLPLWNGVRGAKQWRRSIGHMLQNNENPIQAVQYAIKNALSYSYSEEL